MAEKNLQTGKKTLWEKEKLLVASNFSFSTVFSKDVYRRHVKSRACLGKDKARTSGAKTSILILPEIIDYSSRLNSLPNDKFYRVANII